MARKTATPVSQAGSYTGGVDNPGTEQKTEMPLAQLHSFEGHPFKVLDDELMEQTVESVKMLGVVQPLIVRSDPEGGYEILSGHRRLRAAELAGLETVPVIVREMDDDAAIIYGGQQFAEGKHPAQRAGVFLQDEAGGAETSGWSAIPKKLFPTWE